MWRPHLDVPKSDLILDSSNGALDIDGFRRSSSFPFCAQTRLQTDLLGSS
jgi:hypothetical protein